MAAAAQASGTVAAAGQIPQSPMDLRQIPEFCLKCDEKPRELGAEKEYESHVRRVADCFSELWEHSNMKR